MQGWMGQVVKLLQGSQFDHCFEREDGERFEQEHPHQASHRRLLRVALR